MYEYVFFIGAGRAVWGGGLDRLDAEIMGSNSA
jgi:hypothetical protein